MNYEEKRITSEDVMRYVIQNNDDIVLMDFLNDYTFPYTNKYKRMYNKDDN